MFQFLFDVGKISYLTSGALYPGNICFATSRKRAIAIFEFVEIIKGLAIISFQNFLNYAEMLV